MTETKVELTPEQASAELLRRKRARVSLAEYARSIDIPGAPANADPETEVFKPIETSMALHHVKMCEAIQRTIEKKRGRLMIFMPPGAAKSSYTSVVTPVWCMSKWDGYRIILASYASELAERQSRKTRALARDRRQSAIWESKPTLADDQKAVHDWSLSNGSNLMASGFQAGITGNRANGLIIDDPVKNREQADSPTYRQKTKDEFRESAKSRLLPNGWIIIIQTRWHEDDLAGSILPEDYDGESGLIKCRDGQEWEVLNIPAKCEHEDDPLGRKVGQYLWPEWTPAAHWQEFENDPQGKRTWSSLYQQRPKPGEGIKFTREMFRWYDPDKPIGEPGGLPDGIKKHGATDNATKDEHEAGHKDFTEHCIAGLDKAGDIYFIDWWYGQKTTDVTTGASVALMQRHKPHRWAHESGPIEHALMPAWRRAMREAQPSPVFVTFEPMPSIKNKEIKLGSLESWASQGRVWLPINREWATRLVDQLCAFPAGKYDDAADAAGLFARMIDKLQKARVESSEPKPPIRPFSVEWLEYEDRPDVKIRYS